MSASTWTALPRPAALRGFARDSDLGALTVGVRGQDQAVKGNFTDRFWASRSGQ
ncbi:hypothetical protein [Methylobacterium sp. SD21]|uniref:hypothetical protein n=1 Tax=Methylobacterium litchii TaxID=3138810 RepID=UPI00313CECCC